MLKYFTIHKDMGETPLEATEKARTALKLPIHVPLAYAGRLDPMATGKLLILVGDECKKQEIYHGLDKRYEFEVLFEYATDTGDILGIPTYTPYRGAIREDEIRDAVDKLNNTEITLPYPVYSSKTVKGRPLFMWALEHKLHHIEIPTATSKLYNLTYHGSRQLSPLATLEQIRERISQLNHVKDESKELGADFRRERILKEWEKMLTQNETAFLGIARFSCVCSAGTYIRSLAPHIASKISAQGLAFSIDRTHIGRYRTFPIFRKHGYWKKTF